jgi:hypothetical protein
VSYFRNDNFGQYKAARAALAGPELCAAAAVNKTAALAEVLFALRPVAHRMFLPLCVSQKRIAKLKNTVS